MEIENKVVIVTGGARGIGFQIVKNYLEHNPKVVVILDIDKIAGYEAVKQLSTNKAVFLECDITNSKQVDEVFANIFDTYKTVGILINNAGFVSEANPKRAIAVNLTALIEISMKVWNKIGKHIGGNGGTIINIASIYGYRDMNGFAPTYKATKHGIIGFTKGLGNTYNYEKTGVRVIALCPGFTKTTMTVDIKHLWANEFDEDLSNDLLKYPFQEAEDVGIAAVDILEKAESGSYWLIEGGKPIVKVKTSYDLKNE